MKRIRRVVGRLSSILVVMDPVEQARAKRLLGAALIGGAIVIGAPGAVKYVLANKIANPAMAQELFDALDRVLTLIQAIGGSLAAIVAVYSGIKMMTSE